MYDNDIITMKQLLDATIVTFHIKKINILNAKQIEVLLLSMMEVFKNDIILDLSNVVFIDSTGFAMLHKIKIQSFINKVNILYINIEPELEDLMNFINQN